MLYESAVFKIRFMAGLLSEKINKNFIVIEGLDGSGKGTQIGFLKKYFEDKNDKNVLFTFEPTKDGEWSKKIEDVLLSKVEVTNEQRQLLFILDRKDHIHNVISPALKKGKKVICDRFFLSTLAYGSLGGKTHWKTFWNHHKEIIGDEFIMPSKIIFFDLAPDIAVQRIEKRNETRTVFETLARLKPIREAYLSVGPHFEGFEVIDASGTPEQVFELTKQSLAGYL